MKKSELNILVVDDDTNFRKSLSEALKRFGYKVTDTAKPEEALNLVKIKNLSGAVIDCMLPRINGVDLVGQIRKTRFANGPVVLVSGVFKDKGFANESIEKTQAVAFLHKPFDLEELKKIFDRQFEEELASESVPLQVLVSKPFSSARERTKVIEGLEEIKGFDLPFVLSVLLDANASGYLNIVNPSGELFGITLNQGRITKVDSSETEATLCMVMIQEGYVTAEDLRQVGESGQRGDLISVLIEQQYLSPHVLPVLRKEQIFTELRRLFVDESMQISFVPNRLKTDEFGFNLNDLTDLLHEVVEMVITPNHLQEFYRDWMDYPIRLGPAFKPDHPLFTRPVLQRIPKLAEILSSEYTMEEICSQGKFSRADFFKGLHFLAFHRLVIFDDVKKVKGVAEYGARMKTLLKDLQGKNPIQVFAYFGAPEGSRDQEIERIYKEFARANHPDLLPPTAPEEMRQVVNQVFSIVSEASAILLSPEKRQKLQNSLRQKEAESQIRAEALAEEAVGFLKRGRSSEALERTQEAMGLLPSRTVKIAHVWALLKVGGEDATKASQAAKILESIPHEERRNAQYLFVSGLLKKALGDFQGAAAQFDKAIAMDPNFLDARREKTSVSAKGQKTDIFNSDLTALVGGFFKKK